LSCLPFHSGVQAQAQVSDNSVLLANVLSVPSLLLCKLLLKSTHYTRVSTSTWPSLVLVLISSARSLSQYSNLLRSFYTIPRLASLMSKKSFWLECRLVFLVSSRLSVLAFANEHPLYSIYDFNPLQSCGCLSPFCESHLYPSGYRTWPNLPTHAASVL